MDEHELHEDPIAQLQMWHDEAQASVPQPDAMTVTTVGPDGRPSARIVLLRGIDERGLSFFTNRTSRKGEDLARNPRAALVLHWWELGRQVRIEGDAVEIAEDESAAYWSSRPRASQIAGWATETRFDAREVPLPPFWGGYRVVPDRIEFWAHRDNRLHDRIRYIRRSDASWRRERLAP
jgi:pyridoxamine 5'-phosphate oxidase